MKTEVWRNKKTGVEYTVSKHFVINSTNAQDGQVMVFYTNGTDYFVREVKEFNQKFEQVTDGK